jgi:glycosyltransferase involved in cell wall biosynthesis
VRIPDFTLAAAEREAWPVRMWTRARDATAQTGAIRDSEASRRAVEEAADAFASTPAAGIAGGVVVVIPAYNEAESIEDVVGSVPLELCGLPTATLVIDDGSSDATAERARGGGALVCGISRNVGQGTALRLGYRLARELGARFICTADADGQFDPRELPELVQPLVDGEADFVNGSRRLGRSFSSDPVRNLGVVVFGSAISVLTGVRITDPANGLRALRAEITAVVPLRQPQYQTSELLITTIAHGYRVKEVPVTMHGRRAGRTKKGPNLIYGVRFARVVLTTWWAERPTARRLRADRKGLW